MKKLLLTSIIFLSILNILYASNSIIYDGKNYFFADKILVVLKDGFYTEISNTAILNENLQKQLEALNYKKISKAFNIKSKESNAGSFLNRVYEISFNNNMDVKLLCAKLSKYEGVEIAEPYYLSEAVYTPNDPTYPQQYALSKINAAAAWDITKGSKNVIIAIIDTGVDWDHPDLAANIWVNLNEIPNNGIDDDTNGMIDDIRGWDFGGLTGIPDNDPMEDRPDHGTLVAGCAAAVTDNGIGIAAIGFNSSIMPVKTSQDNIRTNTGKALIAYGYQGIIYAADNGAAVINCSWGSYTFSTISKAVIDYAILVKNSSVVAAMGNDNIEDAMYPANYPGVLSVASTSTDDTRSSFSNYGYGVDVCAPGTGIYSTWMNDTYTTASGTSLSTPILAGLCALVKNQFPLYNALQINEQVRTNCDDIYSINPSFDKKLGKGRINAFNALNNVNSKSLRLNEYSFEETINDGVFKPGENLKLTVHLLNYLTPLSLVNITLTSNSNYVTITNNSFSASSIGMMEIFDNRNSKFNISLATNTPPNTTVTLFLNYSASGYNDFEAIEILVNPTFATQYTDAIEFTATNKGTIGYNDYPNNTQGVGFRLFDSSTLLFEGGLLFGTSNTKIVDCVRGSDPNSQSNDFYNTVPFTITIPGQYSDAQGHAEFNDNNAGTYKIGVDVTLDTYTYNETGYEQTAIFRYNFTNNSGSLLSNFYAGLFFDWDVDEANSGTNLTFFDDAHKAAIFYNQGLDYYVAMGLANRFLAYNYYAIANDGSDGGINIYDNFSKQEKWTALTSGLNKPSAGPADVSGVISAGPFDIAQNEKREIAFVVALANSLNEVKQYIELAREKYLLLPTAVNDENLNQNFSFYLDQNYPNPFNPTTTLKFTLANSGFTTLKVYDILGNEIKTLVSSNLEKGNHSIIWDGTDNFNKKVASGTYIYRLISNGYMTSKKMILIK